MTIITIGNQAGSAGKSTTVVTLAGILASRGRRVRVVDSDAQGNASFQLGVTDPDASTADVLLQRSSVDDVEVATKVDGLTLVPASSVLDGAVLELSRALGGEQRLARALRQASPVDVTLIDCPGALSILTVGALIAADAAVTVTQPSLKELAGVPAFQETVDQVREAYNPRLELAGVLPCIVPPPNQGKVYEMALALLRETYGELVTPPVRRSPRVPEAYSHQLPLHVHAPREPVTLDYIAVVDYLLSRGVL